MATRRLALSLLTALVLAALSFGSVSGRAASLSLTSSFYPPGTRVFTIPPTNANLQSLFGQFHRHSYKRLGRLNGKGWIQVGVLRSGRRYVAWVYGISFYPNIIKASTAGHDILPSTAPSLRRGVNFSRFLHLAEQHPVISD